jgi:pimeloyl-ACP methyl ester carboxylesterase
MLRAFAGGRVFGVATGDPPRRVLALPGWMHTVADYDGVFAALPAGTGAVALDLPGFGGGTAEPAEATGSAGYATVVEPVLTGQDGVDPPVVLVGHSFGGRVAVHLAANHPDLVAGLVLTGVPNLLPREGPATKPALGYRLARALHARKLLPDERMEAIRRRSGSADYRNAPSVTMRNVLVTVTNENYEAQLRRLTCPVELVWGEEDTAAPVEMARRAADLLGDRATLTVLPGIGHLTPTLAPEAVAAAIGRHLR